MSNPVVHAERAVKKWGGSSKDYLEIHTWFDSTKSHLPDNRHRTVLHNSFGIALAEKIFGRFIVNSAGKRVFVQDIGIQHVTEDLGFIPSLAEALDELPIRPWMAGGAKALRGASKSIRGDGREQPQVGNGRGSVMTQPPDQNATHRKTNNELVEMAECLGLEANDLDEAVHDAKGEEAARINNAGLEAQIEFLVTTHGTKTVEELLHRIEAETDDQEG